jgi:hypothetical protein
MRWLAVALLMASMPAAAWAQGDVIMDREPEPAALVLMLVVDDDAGIVKRLGAELAALGFRLQTAPAPTGVPVWKGLEAAARDAEAVAALRVSASSTGVEVWVSDRVTGKTVLREVVTSEVVAQEERDALIALRAVELLRASLLEVESTLPPRGEVKAPEPVREAAKKVLPSSPEPDEPERVPPSMWLGVAGGLGWGRGAPPTAHATLQARGTLHRWLELEGGVVAPLSSISIEEPEGQANVLWSTLLVDANVPLLRPDGAWGLRVGLGVGVSWLHVEATAAPPYASASDDLFVAWPHGHLAASWAPVEQLRLVLAARVGATTPRPVVRFAGRDVLQFGRPLALITFGPELGLF